MIQYRESLKLFHFQCKLFAQHKASDDTLINFDDLFDKFFETYQGHLNKRLFFRNDLSITIDTNLSSDKMIILSSTLINMLKKLTLGFDLSNIRDEIVGTINKFIYLLSFK